MATETPSEGDAALGLIPSGTGGASMDEDRIRAQVRDRLRTGVLPTALPPADPAGGHPASPVPAIRTEQGTGEPCAACEEPIAVGEPLEACAYPSGQVLRFHGWCYKIWNDERAAL
jgi:hypothetical protein